MLSFAFCILLTVIWVIHPEVFVLNGAKQKPIARKLHFDKKYLNVKRETQFSYKNCWRKIAWKIRIWIFNRLLRIPK